MVLGVGRTGTDVDMFSGGKSLEADVPEDEDPDVVPWDECSVTLDKDWDEVSASEDPGVASWGEAASPSGRTNWARCSLFLSFMKSQLCVPTAR